MKAIINPSMLAKILKKSAPAISKNTVLPILSSVLIEFEKGEATVKATNLETSIISTMDCDCKDNFYLIIEYAKLFDICSKISDPLSIDTSGDKTIIKSDKSNFKFAKSVDQDHFPKIEADDFLFSFEAESDFFWSLSSANSCKHIDSNRVTMNAPCVHIKKDSVSLIGTDALVLYKNTLKIKTGKEAKMMVPDQFVQMVKGFADGKVSVSEKFIKVENGNTSIISKLFDAKFCEYEFILPPEINYNFKIKRSDLIECLEIAGVTASATTHMACINFNGGDIKIVSQDVDYDTQGESTVNATHEVEIERIGINGNQMLKLLNIFDSEEVEMAFTAQNKTIFLRPAGEPNTLSLLQPLMIN